MTLYAVFRSSCGAHEPDGLLSLWTTLQAAEKEAERVSVLEFHTPIYEVEVVEVDRPSDEPIR